MFGGGGGGGSGVGAGLHPSGPEAYRQENEDPTPTLDSLAGPGLHVVEHISSPDGEQAEALQKR